MLPFKCFQNGGFVVSDTYFFIEVGVCPSKIGFEALFVGMF
jgi:hypothetical protein